MPSSDGHHVGRAADKADLLVVDGRQLDLVEIREIVRRGYPKTPREFKGPLSQAERRTIEEAYYQDGERYYEALVYLGRHGEPADLDLLESIAARPGGNNLVAKILAEAGRPASLLRMATHHPKCGSVQTASAELLELGIAEGVRTWFRALEPGFVTPICAREINLIYAQGIAGLSTQLEDFDYLAHVGALWERDPAVFGGLVLGLYRMGATVDSLRVRSCAALHELANSQQWPDLATGASVEIRRVCAGDAPAVVSGAGTVLPKPAATAVRDQIERTPEAGSAARTMCLPAEQPPWLQPTPLDDSISTRLCEPPGTVLEARRRELLRVKGRAMSPGEIAALVRLGPLGGLGPQAEVSAIERSAGGLGPPVVASRLPWR
jgi:hypothetical protein